MNKTVTQVLSGNGDNHILPFLWQHGEDKATLRELMGAIHGAVCVESCPHPDFCCEKWWQNMAAILGEARKRHRTDRNSQIDHKPRPNPADMTKTI